MPEQTWFERSADGLSATIGCVNADVKWSVRCVDNVWLGYHANCTLGQQLSTILLQAAQCINTRPILINHLHRVSSSLQISKIGLLLMYDKAKTGF